MTKDELEIYLKSLIQLGQIDTAVLVVKETLLENKDMYNDWSWPRFFFHSNDDNDGIDIKKWFNVLNFLKKCIKDLELDTNVKQTFKQIYSFDNNRLLYINKKIRPFQKFGRIEYNDGCLAIVERKNRKKDYHYLPTLLRSGEFKKYLEILKRETPPLREQFIITGAHWISGELHLDDDNVAKVLFIDPTGSPATYLYHITEKEVINFSEVFPKHKIFVTQNRRQYSMLGCSVYALDDSAHLARLRLEKKYDHTKLWGFLNDASKNNTAKSLYVNNNVSVILCELPLSLMRTMQSQSLLNDVIPNRTKTEQETPINKKNETAAESAKKYFKNNGSKLQNTRLSYKLDKLKNHILNFLIHNQPHKIEQMIQEPTLEHFEKRRQHNRNNKKIIFHLPIFYH